MSTFCIVVENGKLGATKGVVEEGKLGPTRGVVKKAIGVMMVMMVIATTTSTVAAMRCRMEFIKMTWVNTITMLTTVMP